MPWAVLQFLYVAQECFGWAGKIEKLIFHNILCFYLLPVPVHSPGKKSTNSFIFSPKKWFLTKFLYKKQKLAEITVQKI